MTTDTPFWATRAVPGWFHDAKFGIFIHWGPYSVPAWAPVTDSVTDVMATRGMGYWMRHNGYAEWYQNSLRIPGSDTHQYHQEHYGADVGYDNFVEEFKALADDTDLGAWTDLFLDAGARYVVLVTKHHDGVTLWPTAHRNPHRPDYHLTRDIVGELTDLVRARGMEMGLYYSGGFDWTFDPEPVTSLADLVLKVPGSQSYGRYVDAHWRELIDRYAPAILWNDIGYPPAGNLRALFDTYYTAVSEGVVNDRFGQSKAIKGKVGEWLLRGVFGMAELGMRLSKRTLESPAPQHYDFRTPEYASYSEIRERKWEATRGLGFSFGYNRQETEDTLLSPTKLVHSLVDVVSKNGNLLLNVGPRGDGTIPETYQTRLRALGAWLRVQGDAIYGTRPWARAEGQATTASGEEREVRFTQKTDAAGQRTLYATVLAPPEPGALTLKDVTASPDARITLLGHGALSWRSEDSNVVVDMPSGVPDAPAHALAITPAPSL